MMCKRIGLYFLMIILLISTCVIDVAATGDSGTQQYIPQVDQHREDWKLLGIDGKTTLFVGDSYFTTGFWKSFYIDYQGKDAMIAGVGGTTARDWEYFLDYYLRYTCPKNIVVNLVINDIHNDHESADTVTENLQNLLSFLFARVIIKYKKTKNGRDLLCDGAKKESGIGTMPVPGCAAAII